MLENSSDDCDNPWQTTQIDKYIARPNNTYFNNMCMAKFFSHFHYMPTERDIDDDSEDTDEDADDVDGQPTYHILQRR